MPRLTNRQIRILVLGAALGGLIGVASLRSLSAQQGPRPAPPQGYITGVVRGDRGPEAGVWVIAETKDLPTPFAKIVVTDDSGRFMLPELACGHLQRVGARLRPRRLGRSFRRNRDRRR
jgi:hypothetical protein